MANFAGRFMRRLGPLLPENKVGRANLARAFPEKSPAEINAILRGVWDNLGRMGAEFAQSRPAFGLRFGASRAARAASSLRKKISTASCRLANDGKPALIFAAHLANWELPAVRAAKYNLDSAVLYRRPNIAAIDRWLRETRAAKHGRTHPHRPRGAGENRRRAQARRSMSACWSISIMLRGVEVTFFGRAPRPIRCWHGLRNISIARSTACGSSACPAIAFAPKSPTRSQPVRDAQGNIDIAGTMQIITSVIEGWIREYPEQWLWLHRRWRAGGRYPRKAGFIHVSVGSPAAFQARMPPARWDSYG